MLVDQGVGPALRDDLGRILREYDGDLLPDDIRRRA